MSNTQKFDMDLELTKRFTHHPPKEGQPDRYNSIKKAAHNYAKIIVGFTPTSREQSLALTKLEEVVFWANAAIARNE